MRNLTIKRNKSFVGCLGKFKVYIEDATAAEIYINNIPCRKVGTLKNGEEKTFAIDETETKVFVIADKLSKNYCNEFYRVPAGEGDIYLSGKSCFNPAAGNAFRFDGVPDAEVIMNRKRGTRKGIAVLCISALIGGIFGVLVGLGAFSGDVEPKTFETSGIKITLTDDFVETDMDGYDTCFDSKNVAVFVSKEEFSTAQGLEAYTPQEYGNLVLQNNSLPSSVTLQSRDGLTFFEYSYSNTENGVDYHFNTMVYKSSDAFWLVQFATPEQDLSEYSDDIFDWATSVEFVEN